MAIIGTHMLLYTSDPVALRGVLRDVFGWKHVDVGDGWLIFSMPPAEIGVHPAEGPTYESGFRHQITLMCDDLDATRRELRGKPGVEVKGEPKDEGWGITCMLGLPGGAEVMLYQPRHAMAISARPARAGATRSKAKAKSKSKPTPSAKRPAARGQAARSKKARGRKR